MTTMLITGVVRCGAGRAARQPVLLQVLLRVLSQVLLLLAAACAVAPAPATAAPAAATAAAGAQVSTEEPRAFGYQVGEVFSRQVEVLAPAAWQLDTASLPQVRRGAAIELRRLDVSNSREGEFTRHRVNLHYQIFSSPPAVRTLELPPWQLQFDAGGSRQELRVDAWPVTVAPLVPQAVSPRTGLGELQPDLPPPLLNTQPVQRRLQVYGALALLVLAGLAVLLLGPPWRAYRRRPFGLLWPQLQALPAQPSAAQWQQALRAVHEALNRSAGAVLFASTVPAFVAVRPGFVPLQDDIQRFLQRSQREFFAAAGGGPQDGDVAWLRALGRRLRDAERGLAR